MNGKPVVKAGDTIEEIVLLPPATLVPGLPPVPVPGSGGFLIGEATVTIPADIARLEVLAEHTLEGSEPGTGIITFQLTADQRAAKARTHQDAPVPVVVQAGQLQVTYTVVTPATEDGNPIDPKATYRGTAIFVPTEPVTVFAG